MFPALGKAQLNLPDLLDFNLEHNPDFPVFIYGEVSSAKTTEIKMLEYVRAAHRVGKVIRGDSQTGDVVGIVANLDTIVYSALIVGIMKAGLVPFPISPRNSPSALVHLIRKSSVHRIIVTKTTLQGVVDGLKAELEMVDPDYALSIEEAPTLYEVYPKLGKETVLDPFTLISRTLSPNDSDKGIYFHSSGSTGLPKPILLTHQIIKRDASLLHIPKLRQAFPNSLVGAIGIPTFHLMGFCYQVLMPLYWLVTAAVFAPTSTTPDAVPLIATAENVLETAKILNPTYMVAVPTLIHTWSQSDDDVEFLRTLGILIFGGGPLAPRIAESLISRGVTITAAYGGTEFGIVTELRLDTETWQYLEFMKDVNIRWVPQGDGTFEAQFLTSERHYVAVENIADVSGYSTSDLFRPHPTIPNLWKIVGRVDDVIIHSSGEKTVPAPMEAIISASPMLSGAIIFGRQRDQPGILLEPLPVYQVNVNNEVEISKFRNLIWPWVEEANKVAPAFSRIFKEMILVVNPEKPLPRVGKGTVARKAALVVYESEIDKLYETVESSSGGASIEPPTSWGGADIQAWLIGQISDTLSMPAPDITEDLFEHGFDSLSATILRLRLISALRKSGFSALAATIPQGIVYSYPTIGVLSDVLERLVTNPSGNNTFAMPKTHEESIEEMISKYTQGLEASPPNPAKVDPTRQYVLLTGSTGNLGAQLLESLLLNDSVARVYTLNRLSAKISMYERHCARLKDKALDISLLSSPKLVFLDGETSREDLGLSEDTLKELRQNLTMIIHNAWRLDFNLSLPSFESHVKGSRVLIDLARSSRHSSSIRFLFTSSIGSAQSWNAQIQGPYPEKVVMDAKYAVGAGYGESKYITERILAKSGLQATSFRIGQITGGVPNGAWATSDWVPIIVKSSLSIGMLPDVFGVVSWLPIDAVCKALLDVGFSQDDPVPIAVNIVHPHPVSWSFVIQNIRSALIQEKHLSSDSLPLVPYHEWVDTVEQHARYPTEADTQNIPAIKLVDFYRAQSNADDALRKSGRDTFESAGLPPLHTHNVERLSETVRTLKPLDETIVWKWVRYWIGAGF